MTGRDKSERDTTLSGEGRSVSNPDRRNFLRATIAAAAVGGTVGVTVPFGEDRTVRQDYPIVEKNKVLLAPNGHKVVIIGGGLAGLQAGVELAARGFHVTILEKSGTPGGKLKTWRDKSFGPNDDPVKRAAGYKGYARQHGIHCVWQWYNNLREFMGRYQWRLQEVPANPSIYHFFDKDGTKSHLGNPTWVAPFDWIQLAWNAGDDMGHISEQDRRKAVEVLAKLATFDYTDPKQRSYLDGITFADYAKEVGMPASAMKLFDSLFEMATYERISDDISALTAGFLAQLWAGSPEDFRYSWFSNPPGETFIAPMVEFIKQHGGDIHYNTEVTQLVMEDGKIKAVRTNQLPRGMRVRRCRICGELIWGNDHHDECPYCGADGAELADLSPEETIERTFSGEFFISATDIPGAQQIISANWDKLRGHEYFRNIMNLHATEVYVLGFWVKGKDFWKRLVDKSNEVTPGGFLTGYKHLGIIFNWTWPYIRDKSGQMVGLNPEYKDYDVSMLEVHIGSTKDFHGLPTKDIADRVYAELREALPELPPYSDYYVNKWWTYTTYRVDDEKCRPPVQSPIDNLLYIGDMAFVPHVAVYMEKTNVTAKWATNLILDKIHQPEGKIEILPSGTPRSIPIMLLKTVESVYA